MLKLFNTKKKTQLPLRIILSSLLSLNKISSMKIIDIKYFFYYFFYFKIKLFNLNKKIIYILNLF